MPFTHTLHWNITPNDRSLSRSAEYVGNAESNVSESIADSSTDLEISFTLDVSAVKSFYIVSDQAITVETNSGSAADNTLTLVAGVPYMWHTGSYDSFLFDTDITALFITNASGSAAALEIMCSYDPTP